MGELLFYAYMIFGILYGIYDWNVNQKEAYKKDVETGNIEAPMISIYWIFMICLWPIWLIIEIIKMKEEANKYWDNHKNQFKFIFDNIYSSGFWLGRHKERETLANSGWLIIDPNKREEFEKCLEDPCKYCEHYIKEYKQGCNLDPEKCGQKQKQILALEIKTYFDLI